jgi:hypothetical protein
MKTRGIRVTRLVTQLCDPFANVFWREQPKPKPRKKKKK